jgi:hypothetical protein
MALFVLGRSHMPVRPFDREFTDQPRHSRTEPRREAKPVPERSASPLGDEEDQHGEEITEEPGYGHGV